MAKSKFITDDEKDLIRIGVALGNSDADIARFIGRKRPTVTVWRHKMIKDGTIGNLPFDFVVDDVSEKMAAAKGTS
jgi:hypothetical protein